MFVHTSYRRWYSNLCRFDARLVSSRLVSAIQPSQCRTLHKAYVTKWFPQTPAYRYRPTKNVYAPVTLAASYPVFRLIEVTLFASRPRTLSHALMTLMHGCHAPGCFIRNKLTRNYLVGQQWLSKSYHGSCDPSQTRWAYGNRLNSKRDSISE